MILTAAFLATPRRPSRTLPGFGLGLGFGLIYLSLVVLIPLSALILRAAGMGLSGFAAAALDPRALAAYRLSFISAGVAASVNGVFGLLVAWVLVRYRIPGKRLFDALIDLPFALPTAVAGIALTTLYAKTGWIGAPLAKAGIAVAFTPLGIVVALVFIGLPFVVRTVEPVIQELDHEQEEAAASLGAGRLQTVVRVILPAILPAVVTGAALAFARGLGEYGSVVFIAGNLPMISEISPVLIVIELAQYDYGRATAIAAVMLAASFALLLTVNLLQRVARTRMGQ
jgi:sulfate/thiosulfate transport system permease protein